MSTKTLTIPAVTIPQGAHVFGPVTPNAAWSHFDLLLDIASAPAPFDVLVETSADGLVWSTLLQNLGAQPYVKNGVPVNTLLLSGNLPVQPVLQVRVTTTSPQAFSSTGGSINLS